MNLNFSDDELSFRDEVRDFVARNLPAEMASRMRAGDDGQLRADIVDWQKILNGHGWGAPAWPKEFGGTGWSKTQQ